jgi:hypothetical protein
MSNITKVLIGVCALVLSVNATVITFDDVSNTSVVAKIENGYDGLDWNNFYVINRNVDPSTGYANGTVSGDYTAINGWGNAASCSDGNVDGNFNFNGAYLTSAWYGGNNITVDGLNNGTMIYSKTVTVNTQDPTWFDFNFNGIDQLTFSSSAYAFAMDNLTINFTTTSRAVPEPGVLSMLFVGLLSFAGFVAVRKRK